MKDNTKKFIRHVYMIALSAIVLSGILMYTMPPQTVTASNAQTINSFTVHAMVLEKTVKSINGNTECEILFTTPISTINYCSASDKYYAGFNNAFNIYNKVKEGQSYTLTINKNKRIIAINGEAV